MADTGMTVGLIKALAPKPSAEDITTAVDAWLDDHPEATTTVEDGAISYAKLNSSLQGTVDDVADLKSHIENNVAELYIGNGTNKTPQWTYNYRLSGNGLYTADENSRVKYYPLNNAKKVYIKASKDGDYVYQFVSGFDNHPTSGTNSKLRGSVSAAAVDSVVIVPNGATHVVVSSNAENTTNYVQGAISQSSLNSTQIEELGSDLDLINENIYSLGSHVYDMIANKTRLNPKWTYNDASLDIDRRGYADENGKIIVYQVTAGSKIFLSCAKYSPCVYYYSASLYWPPTGKYPPTAIDGVHTQPIADITVIPEGAQYLYISCAAEDTSSGIYSYESRFDEITRKFGDAENSIAMFPSIGFIGDSYSSGCVIPGATPPPSSEWGNYVHYDKSWCKMIARRNGIDDSIYAYPGLTTRSWLTDSHGLTQMNADTAKDLYVIVLGINDVQVLGSSYLGTEADFDLANYQSTPNTFYGNMCKIIGYVLAKNPYARIVLSTMANNTLNSTYASFNQAIIRCAELAGVPYIEQYNNWYFKSTVYTDRMMNGHPTIPNYSGMSIALEKMLTDTIKNFPNYYKEWTGLTE